MLWCVPAYAQQTHILVITGVPGDEEHAAKFQKWATSFIDAAKKKDAVADANITCLAERRRRATRSKRRSPTSPARAKPNEAVVVLLIGHGSFNGPTPHSTFPGPT